MTLHAPKSQPHRPGSPCPPMTSTCSQPFAAKKVSSAIAQSKEPSVPGPPVAEKSDASKAFASLGGVLARESKFSHQIYVLRNLTRSSILAFASPNLRPITKPLFGEFTDAKHPEAPQDQA